MLFRSGRAPWIVGSLLLVSAGCSRRNLDVGDGTLAGLGGRGGLATDAAPPDGSATGGSPQTGDGRAGTGGQGGPDRLDAAESGCVAAAIPLPWMKTLSKSLRLAVVASSDAIAVMNRLPDRLDVRTFGHDGTAIGGFQFQADAQFLPYRDDLFLLVSRSTTGDFMVTSLGRTLTGGTRLATATATATEHMLGAVAQGTNVVLVTDENFVSFGAGGGVPWYSIIGDADTFKRGRIYGMAAQPDRTLIAWRDLNDLRLATVTPTGTLVARAEYGSIDVPRVDVTSAVPYGAGLLMFDSNPVRLTQLGFDVSSTVLGRNSELATFDRTASQVAAISLQGRLIAFWLTVFPAADASDSPTTHQLYGCQLDLANPAACASTSLIADTGLGGYAIGDAPVAAAALPGGSTFAVAHSDVFGQSWLRIGDLGCAVP